MLLDICRSNTNIDTVHCINRWAALKLSQWCTNRQGPITCLIHWKLKDQLQEIIAAFLYRINIPSLPSRIRLFNGHVLIADWRRHTGSLFQQTSCLVLRSIRCYRHLQCATNARSRSIAILCVKRISILNWPTLHLFFKYNNSTKIK